MCSPEDRERLTTMAGGKERQRKQGELKESAGSTSSPYYYFYTDEDCSTTMASPTQLQAHTTYTFKRCSNADSHPFIIFDDDIWSTSLITFRSVEVTVGAPGTTHAWKCTQHSYMTGTFTAVEANVCLNGATCVDDENGNGYACQCAVRLVQERKGGPLREVEKRSGRRYIPAHMGRAGDLRRKPRSRQRKATTKSSLPNHPDLEGFLELIREEMDEMNFEAYESMLENFATQTADDMDNDIGEIFIAM